MNVALIGNGYWGKIYQKTLEKILDTKVRVYTRNYQEIFYTDIDCAIIATPAETHFQIAKECLLMGIDVLIEKPFIINSCDTTELRKLASDKLVVMPGHIYLHHEGIIKLKEIIKNKDFGDVKYVYSKRMGNSKHPNALWEMGSHDLYILNYLFDNYVVEEKSIFGDISHCIFNMQYEKVLYDPDPREHVIKASIEVGNYSYQHDKIREIIIQGTKKRVVFDDMSPVKIKVIDNKTQDIEFFQINQEITPLEKQCIHFFDCIKNHKEPISNIHDGFKNIRSLELLTKML
jgi:predicted dehydrogenase